ncbi:thioesterase [Trichophyton tonsurans CBS 112818]|uniref:Thioesterase n=1 Tax=Trichophyton tonsurans (strain CBS 112818) TaxID=647933 RepID=F2S3U6_TRIT1|nr:thioesterase [Trichophyton tonsurans CBS 112818]
MARLALGLRHTCCLSPLRHQLLRQVPASARSIRAPARPYSSAQSQSASQGAYSYTYPPPSPPTYKKRSLFRRILGFSAIAIGSFLVGAMTNPELLDMGSEIASMRQLSKTDLLYIPPDEISKESCHHFTWSTTDGSSFVSIFYLGSDVCGHPGIVHGGLLATLLDEGLARTCFPVLPNKIGVTANLNIDYRAPAPAGEFFVLRAKVTKVDGRKAWVEGWIEGLPKDGTDPVKYVEAKALFIEPKMAAVCSIISPISYTRAEANVSEQVLTGGQKDTFAKSSPSTPH